MIQILLLPVKLLGIAAAGAALGAGWKVGSYLADTAIANKDRWQETVREKVKECYEKACPDPLWKRKFTRLSDEG